MSPTFDKKETEFCSVLGIWQDYFNKWLKLGESTTYNKCSHIASKQ